MVRSEIISKLSQRIHRKLKKSDLDKILQVIVNTIVDGIIDNRSTELRGFGIPFVIDSNLVPLPPKVIIA